MNDKDLIIKDLSFGFGVSNGNNLVIDQIDLSFFSNTISVIVGPSGCGKTTLLNLIAGILIPNGGFIQYSEKKNIKKPKIGFVFQNPSLIPWRTVRENVLLGAEISKNRSFKIEEQADSLLHSYGLSDFANEYPSTLSGGMQQRVSIIRAVIYGADILLLDEPFSNTDFALRKELQRDLLKTVTEQNLIAIMVTHDLIEAVKIADQIIALTNRPASVKERMVIEIEREHRMNTDSIVNGKLYKYVEQVSNVLTT